MKESICILVFVLFAAGCSTYEREAIARSPLSPNAYVCSDGREECIRSGFPKVSIGMLTNEIVKLIGYPEKTSPWYARTGKFFFPAGRVLGIKYDYWIRWEDLRPADERWLELYFDSNSKLICIGGNLNGDYFRIPKDWMPPLESSSQQTGAANGASPHR